jgi:hypothetical protein
VYLSSTSSPSILYLITTPAFTILNLAPPSSWPRYLGLNYLRRRDWERTRRVLLIIRDEVDAMIDEGLQCTMPTSNE